jgi:hypothetical protein
LPFRKLLPLRPDTLFSPKPQGGVDRDAGGAKGAGLRQCLIAATSALLFSFR